MGVERPLVVFGVLRDKNCGKMLELLAGEAAASSHPAGISPGPAAQGPQGNRECPWLRGAGFTTAERALEHALRRVGSGQAILVCGSLYLIGEAMQALNYSRAGPVVLTAPGQ